MTTDDGLLAGIRVLDLSIWRPGPYATQLLAEMGADVIKVEPPGGDPMRVYPELFAGLSADKRSIEVDLKSDEGRAEVLALAEEADVVIEGFRPGVAARLGVDDAAVRAINPSVVYCSVSGLGQDGPLALVPGHDLAYLAWSGALAPDGGPPAPPALPIADLSGGMAAAMSICAAIVRRLRTGEGEYIDVAMTDVLATWTGAASSRTAIEDDGGDEEREDRPARRGTPGYGVFDAADGRRLVLSVINEDHFWAPLCEVLGLTDVAGLGFAERLQRGDDLQVRLAEAIRTRSRDELVDALLAVDVPVAPVADRAGMLANPHLRARGVVTSDPWAPVATGHPVVLTRHPAGHQDPPPRLDEHRGARFAPRVRPATHADIGAIQAVGIAAGERFRQVDDPGIAARADDPPYPADELAEMIATGAVWVTEVDGALAGYLAAEVLEGCLHVEEVSVRPEAGGRGLGTALLEAAVARAGADGLAGVTLTTYRDVPWNRPFYERRGFRVLADAELTDGLRAKRAAEAALGLDPDVRVVMRRDA